MGRVTVQWGDAGLTCMRNGDYHGAIIEADLALPIACALPPPFLLRLVAYCTFSTPPTETHCLQNCLSLWGAGEPFFFWPKLFFFHLAA